MREGVKRHRKALVFHRCPHLANFSSNSTKGQQVAVQHTDNHGNKSEKSGKPCGGGGVLKVTI